MRSEGRLAVCEPLGASLDDSECDGQQRVQRRLLRVMFLLTDMRVGGAEVLTANIIRRLDSSRFMPEIGCLKEKGALGEELSRDLPVHHELIAHKYDLRVWPRLTRLLRERRIDAVVTVGAGDKMFWGRLAARRVGVPVVISALHSTGWPDGVSRLNRLLTPITDAFIAVAESHAQFLVGKAGFPAHKVATIPNGVDIERFSDGTDGAQARARLGLDSRSQVVGIVAAMRPEKNHSLFLHMAQQVARARPRVQFLIVGDGPCRTEIARQASELGLADRAKFLGSRSDVPRLLSAMDVFVLTSRIEANPISVLEAMSTGRPVVATNVGSLRDAVADGSTGFLTPPGDAAALATRVLQLLDDRQLYRSMAAAARRMVIDNWSIDSTVRGYEQLIESIYRRKTTGRASAIAKMRRASR